jgi:hypothetical protein
MIRPDRHQRAQTHIRVAVRIPHTNSDSIVVVFHAEFDASLSAPGSFRCVGHVEDVGHTAHESHSARSRVEVTDLAFEVVHLGLPRLDRRRFQCLLKFLRSEAITDWRAGYLLCG